MLYGRNDALIANKPMVGAGMRTNKLLLPLFQHGVESNLVCSFTFFPLQHFPNWSNCTASGTNLLCKVLVVEPNSDAISVLSQIFSPMICQVGQCIVRIETTDMVCFVLINIINLNIRISVYWVRKWHNIKQRPLRFVRIMPTCTTTTSKIPFS